MDVKLPVIEAREILLSYDGANNYILNLKDYIINSKTFTLTRSQSDYINKNYKDTPKIVRLWMEIEDYLSKELMTTKLLQKPPKKIWIEKLLSETDKAELIAIVENDEQLLAFALGVGKITRDVNGYTEPGQTWDADGIKHDLFQKSSKKTLEKVSQFV